MAYAKGDRVRHPTKSEWGLGEVMEDSRGNKVRIFFVDAGEKTLIFDNVKLEKVSGVNACHPGLDNLSLKVAPKLETILSASDYKEFGELYNSAPEVVRSLINELVALVQSKHAGIQVYPTNKPDLRFHELFRVCATIQIKKQAPFIKIDLFKIKGELPGTSLVFEKIGDDVLKSCVYLNDLSDVSDGVKYIKLAISNASKVR
jgi:hypothetical protein